MFQCSVFRQRHFEEMKKKKHEKSSAQNAYIECKELVIERQDCWNRFPEGKHTEECFVEELSEKKMLDFSFVSKSVQKIL